MIAGDPIHAVVRQSKVNQDGKTVGITMPSHQAQQALLTSLLATAQIDPVSIDYVEAHGTGTKAGDTEELKAISSVLSSKKRKSVLFVGSCKGNIGHLESASGIAGVVKMILALKGGIIFPQPLFRIPKKDLRFEEWGIRVRPS